LLEVSQKSPHLKIHTNPVKNKYSISGIILLQVVFVVAHCNLNLASFTFDMSKNLLRHGYKILVPSLSFFLTFFKECFTNKISQKVDYGKVSSEPNSTLKGSSVSTESSFRIQKTS
jgi:hypothetical protein